MYFLFCKGMRIFKNYILLLLISNCIRVLHIKGTKKDVCIAHVTLEADKFQDLQGESASKGLRRACVSVELEGRKSHLPAWRPSERRNPPLLRGGSALLFYWMNPTHRKEGSLLYCVFPFKC